MCKTREICSAQEIRNAVGAVIQDVASRLTLTEETEFHIRLILNELLANSLEHSGGHYAKLYYKLRQDVLHLCILDWGKGFHCGPGQISCPDVLAESGRGVYLVQCFCDSLRYNRQGNAVCVKIAVR